MLEVTAEARRVMAALLAAHGPAAGGLRIGVPDTASEADPATYELAVRAVPAPGDLVLQHAGLRLFLDGRAVAALTGGRIDAEANGLVIDPPASRPRSPEPSGAGFWTQAGEALTPGYRALIAGAVGVTALLALVPLGGARQRADLAPPPAYASLRPVSFAGGHVREACTTRGSLAGECHLELAWRGADDWEGAYLRYGRAGDAARARVAERLRVASGEPGASGEGLVVLLAPTEGPDPRPGVWEVRQGSEVLLSYEHVVADARRRRDDLLGRTVGNLPALLQAVATLLLAGASAVDALRGRSSTTPRP